MGEEFWLEKDGAEFMRIYGNFTEHDHLLQVNGLRVASVHKKWIAMRGEFGVSMAGDIDHRIVIGAVMVIDHVEVTEQNSVSS